MAPRPPTCRLLDYRPTRDRGVNGRSRDGTRRPQARDDSPDPGRGRTVLAALEVRAQLPGRDLASIGLPCERLGRAEEREKLAAEGGHDDVTVLQGSQRFAEGSGERPRQAVAAAEAVLDLLGRRPELAAPIDSVEAVRRASLCTPDTGLQLGSGRRSSRQVSKTSAGGFSWRTWAGMRIRADRLRRPQLPATGASYPGTSRLYELTSGATRAVSPGACSS